MSFCYIMDSNKGVIMSQYLCKAVEKVFRRVVGAHDCETSIYKLVILNVKKTKDKGLVMYFNEECEVGGKLVNGISVQYNFWKMFWDKFRANYKFNRTIASKKIKVCQEVSLGVDNIEELEIMLKLLMEGYSG